MYRGVYISIHVYVCLYNYFNILFVSVEGFKIDLVGRVLRPINSAVI